MFGPATIPAMIAAGIDMQQETYTINVSRLFQFGTAIPSLLVIFILNIFFRCFL
jgi:hypothetical protein